MSIAREHADWLSLLDISGPFLSLPVLLRAFPHGIEQTPSGVRADLRASYAHWLDERDREPTIHHRWVRWVLTGLLELDESQLVEGPRIPAGLERLVAEHHETLRPDIALLSDDGKPALLIHICPSGQDLTKSLRGALWKASPDTRMAELLRGTGIPLGLVTNGERWMLVHAPPKESAGYASWYGDLWLQEPLTLRAFVALLRRGRFFGVAPDERLPALLRDSAQDQADVTEQLGAQVRAAMQVLVQAFDKLDGESNRALLAGVDERTLYEAALTVMMRLVFLLSAEERKLLLRGDPLYDQHYAVGTILDSLQEKADRHGEEILQANSDAWSRLLAVFRAVHGGVQHERLRLPAYGGTLFDPDRFPFLEGRAADTKWKVNTAHPLKVNNRVVLHLLRALQFIETKLPGGGDIAARRLSFRGLDIEQIGHVYEGLLDHTARRAGQVILGLAASKGRIATLPLERLEALAAESPEKLIAFLVDKTERTESSLRNILDAGGEKPRRGRKAATAQFDLLAGGTSAAPPPPQFSHAILAACDHDPALAARIAPYAALLRADTFARPLVILPGSLYVAPGSDRRSTGTHYTPRSLTEPIVQHTLEPLVYRGPAEGLPRGEWRLKTPREILALKICDLAMGSGAFLVGVCRYLSARLVEAWTEVERAHPDAFITSPEGDFSTGDPSEALIARLPDDERLHLAVRAIADRCLYGVDINPMAVEMAKLSLWLITVDRERPFTFLDHALKCGDSLLGLSDARQLERFSLRPADDAQPLFDTANLWRHVQQAATLRRQLEATPSHTAAQLVEKARLHGEAETLLARLCVAADFLLAAELDSPGDRGWDTRRAIAASHMQAGWKKDIAEFQRLARAELRGRRPFHWPLEFPEVFSVGEGSGNPVGFDAFVGNPPFMGGTRISTVNGTDYLAYLGRTWPSFQGRADLCSLFFLRSHEFLNESGCFGLIATNTISQGDTREAGLDEILRQGSVIYHAVSSIQWPGQAGLAVSIVHVVRGGWHPPAELDGLVVERISSQLLYAQTDLPVQRLTASAGKCYAGSKLDGIGFVIDESEAFALLASVESNREVVMPFLNGDDVTSHPAQRPSRFVINFGEREEDDARQFERCFQIVRERVFPERQRHSEPRTRQNWWRFQRVRPELYEAVRGLQRVLVIPCVSKYLLAAFVDGGTVFSHALNVVVSGSSAILALLQSEVHEAWARLHGSTLETRLRYTPTDCFETFPFPTGLSGLEAVGERYHDHRRQLMQARGEGLTKTYNRFHDRGETAADIAELRTLHRQLDTAVAAAYGWPDLAAQEGIALGHDFHETKQGTRWTLAPTARRKILDLLLALNHTRHAEEVAAGLHDKKAGKQKAKRERRPTGAAPMQGDLIPPPQGDLFATQPASLGAAAFATQLIVNLLSEAPGLRMTELARAFRFITNPALMKQDATAADKAAVEAWASHWHSLAGPERFITTMHHLAGATVKATTGDDDPPMALTVAPTPPTSPALREGIRLALRVLRSGPTLAPEEHAALMREVRGLLTTA